MFLATVNEWLDSEFIFEVMIRIGEFIDKQIDEPIYEYKDFNLWRHMKKNTPQILNAEYEYINSVNDETVNDLVKRFVDKHKPMIFEDGTFVREDCCNIITKCGLYQNGPLCNRIIQFKLLCHLTYIINEFYLKINDKNFDETIINLHLYYLDFGIKDSKLFKKKTIALLYNVLNECFTKNTSYLIDKDGSVVYYSKYISSILFFKLYKKIRSIDVVGLGNGAFNVCKYCGALFYSKRPDSNCCESVECKRLRGRIDTQNCRDRKNK